MLRPRAAQERGVKFGMPPLVIAGLATSSTRPPAGTGAVTSPVAKLVYSIPEAVEATGISRAQLYRHRKAGQLTFRKRGRRTFILLRDLEDFLLALPRLGG